MMLNHNLNYMQSSVVRGCDYGLLASSLLTCCSCLFVLECILCISSTESFQKSGWESVRKEGLALRRRCSVEPQPETWACKAERKLRSSTMGTRKAHLELRSPELQRYLDAGWSPHPAGVTRNILASEDRGFTLTILIQQWEKGGLPSCLGADLPHPAVPAGGCVSALAARPSRSCPRPGLAKTTTLGAGGWLLAKAIFMSSCFHAFLSF